MIEAIGFDNDHLHMVMIIPPKYSIASVIGRLKSQTVSELRSRLSGYLKFIGKKILYGHQAIL